MSKVVLKISFYISQHLAVVLVTKSSQLICVPESQRSGVVIPVPVCVLLMMTVSLVDLPPPRGGRRGSVSSFIVVLQEKKAEKV